MKAAFSILFSACVAQVLFAPTAFAHWGHVGELAGHGHLIGIGAMAAAAALAALLLKPDAEEKEEAEGEEEPDTVSEGETA